MKKNPLPVKLGLATLAITYLTGCVGFVTKPTNSEQFPNDDHSDSRQLTQSTGTTPGIVVHIDPKTGEIITPPAGALPGQLPPPLDTTKKLPSEPRESLSPVPGGGVIIHLDGRFVNPLTATTDAEGKVRIEHEKSQSDSHKK